MNGAAFLLLVLTLAVAFVDWTAVHAGRRALEYLCKPLTMVALVATALALDADEPAVQAWFVAALVLSLVGDVFLMLPRDRFVPGLTAFLLAHVAYIVGMHVDGVDAVRFLVGLVAVMAYVAVVGSRIVRGVRSGSEPALAGPVVAYMFVIAAMVASAIGVGHPAGVTGAVLFCASDSLIAWNRFIADTAHARVVIMVTYHLGQMGLVLSLI